MDWAHFTPLARLPAASSRRCGGDAPPLQRARRRRKRHPRRPALRPSGRIAWRAAFVGGLLVAPVAAALVTALPSPRIEAGFATLVVAGLAVGIGTSYGSGCTSGHWRVRLSRLSPRSLVATVAFMARGMATVFVARQLARARSERTLHNTLIAFAAGLVFGVGLLISGMTDPGKVIGFSTSPATGTLRSPS